MLETLKLCFCLLTDVIEVFLESCALWCFINKFCGLDIMHFYHFSATTFQCKLTLWNMTLLEQRASASWTQALHKSNYKGRNLCVCGSIIFKQSPVWSWNLAGVLQNHYVVQLNMAENMFIFISHTRHTMSLKPVQYTCRFSTSYSILPSSQDHKPQTHRDSCLYSVFWYLAHSI